MQTENASPAVIENTAPAHTRYARLYFRPRTPTQYCNEGIRPFHARWRPNNDPRPAHCPVPVFFCFDAIQVLGQDNTEFSDGNMGASRAIHAKTREFFQSIPFEYVYHQGAKGYNETVKFHRHAEVLVPDALPLVPALRMIACRSFAEMQMLLYLLPPDLRDEWRSKIRLGMEGLFERQWTYVETVTALGGKVTFKMNPNTRTEGPFNVRFEYRETETPEQAVWTDQVQRLPRAFAFGLGDAKAGEVRLYLDECLAFADEVDFSEIPF